MYLKLSVFLLCVGLGQVIGISTRLSAKHMLHLSVQHHVKIQRLQSESEMLAEIHQETSTDCFSYFKPIFNQISNQYETNYDNCITEYHNSGALIDAKYAPIGQEFQNAISGSCYVLNACKVNSTQGREGYKCIADNAAEISKNFYSISSNATEIAVKIEEDYRLIDTQKAICLNNAEWTYVENTADSYEKLNACLRGDLILTGTTSRPPNSDIGTTINIPKTTSAPGTTRYN